MAWKRIQKYGKINPRLVENIVNERTQVLRQKLTSD